MVRRTAGERWGFREQSRFPHENPVTLRLGRTSDVRIKLAEFVRSYGPLLRVHATPEASLTAFRLQVDWTGVNRLMRHLLHWNLG